MMLMNAKKPVKRYTCSQAELYSGLETVWRSQKKYSAEFEAENSKYEAGTADLRIAEIEEVRGMGDAQARWAEGEEMRINLKEKNEKLLAKWKSLRGYIRKAFKGAHFKPRIEEAGKGYYARAYQDNWEYVMELAERAKGFIDTHWGVLSSDGGMPGSFAGEYGTLKGEFKELYGQYMKQKQKVVELTDRKILANNIIYEEGRAMMEDGKHIFRKQAAVRERFIWKRILGLMGEGKGRGEH